MTTTTATLMAAIAGAAMLMGAAGCGGDGTSTSPYANTYNIVLHTRNTDGCDSEGEPFTGDEYFKLTDDGKTLGYHTCTAADACSSAVNETLSFQTKQDAAWIGRTIDSTQHRDSCDATLTERSATLENGDVRIETRTYKGNISHDPGVDCDDPFVLDHRTDLACGQYDVIVAVPAK